MAKPIITQEYLKSILNYNPETGMFTWKLRKAKRNHFGDEAGYLKEGYRYVEINGKPFALHRLAFLYMNGEMPENLVDHINGVKNDNRWVNLRNATNQQNTINVKLNANNKSGVRCVSYFKPMKKWILRCTVNKKRHFIGYFDDLDLARIAYEQFAKKHHGEFYRDYN